MAAQLGGQSVELWQENLAAVEVFVDMMTQWNVGPVGVIGLRYEALPVVMRMHRVPGADQAAVFQGVRVMERAAMEVMRRGD